MPHFQSAIYRSERGLSRDRLRDAVNASLKGSGAARALLLPPDFTRMYSGAGTLCALYYEALTAAGADVDVMPALGTHAPMTEDECRAFFGEGVPFSRVIVHNWREDVVKLGVVPGEFVAQVSEGLVCDPIDVEVNRRLVSGEYDLVVSMGQVVPHEVVGMANYSKNIFVGCGGSSMINSSHMLGAFYGMERVMGQDGSPVRRVFDYAEERFLGGVPLLYVLTVTTNEGERTDIHGLYVGRDRSLFEAAVEDSRRYNLTRVDAPIRTAVVYLDPREFKSTWLGNKAVYRTRMAMADGGHLIIIAPGVRRFGEDAENDRLIRKYGYIGRERVLELVRESAELRGNLSVAAHLIHGSSDGRFSITYATDPANLSEAEVRSAGYGWMSCADALARYDVSKLRDGICRINAKGVDTGEEIFYVSNPALGLWTR